MNTGRCGSSACGSSISSKMSPDDELAEIINDFKNNVYTISELEKLVEAWKNRNDVQQSFRDKKVMYHLLNVNNNEVSIF